MEEKMKIGFVGSYSSANLGDWAMLINNIYDLKCNDVTVFTYNEKFPKNSLHEYSSGIKIEYIETHVDRNTNRLESMSLTPFDVLETISNLDDIVKSILELDILIVSGGGWINHFWAEQTEKISKIIAPIYIARQQGKKIFFTANGIGPLENSKELFRYFFRYIDTAKIGIRDDYCSMSYLEEVGVSKENVVYIPDDLYFINHRLINKEIKNKEIKNRLDGKKYIVMEMFYPLEELKENEERLIRFSEIIYDRYGLYIVLLPFDLVWYGLDQAKYLNNILNNSFIYDINKLGYLPIQDAYNIIDKAQFMITSRYHGLVLSLSLETPVIYRMVNKLGDSRYSYNKGFGMLRRAFDGIIIEEKDFLRNSLLDVLDDLENNFEELVSKQNFMYNTDGYRNNKIKLENERKKYLQEISYEDDLYGETN